MANYRAENVLVGAAAIYTAGPGAEVPAGLAAAVGAEAARDAVEGAAGWTSTGYTTGGVEVTYTPDFGEVEVDQELDAVVMFKQRMTVTVGTTLAEATLDNLVFAWGQKDDTLDGAEGTTRTLTIESGALGDRPEERQLLFIGQAPVPTTAGSESFRYYHLLRCLNVESSAHSLSRADATTIPVSFRCLPKVVDNASQYGTITDVVAPAGP